MSQVPDYGLIGEGGYMDAAAKSAPLEAQVRRFLRYAPNFEGKRVVEAYIEELEATLTTNLGKRDAERRRFKLGNPGRSLASPTEEEVDAYLARRGLVQPKTYECCGAPASGEHSPSCPLYGTPDELGAWIEREFRGYGVALFEHPPGAPLMSMEVAKELTRRAVAEFSRPPEPPTTVDALALYDQESWDADQRDGD